MKKKAINPASITWKNIKSFFQGYYRKFLLFIGVLDSCREEQIEWRKTKAKECMENGACLYCGCTMPEKLYSDDACEDPVRKCYPEMMDKKDWLIFKNSLSYIAGSGITQKSIPSGLESLMTRY